MFVKCEADCAEKWPEYTLIQPCVSVGFVGQLAVDLLLENISDIRKIGYFHDKCFMPVVGADPFSKDDSNRICSSCEVFESKNHKFVIVQQRAPFNKGRIPSFRKMLMTWIKDSCFKQLVILGSCSSHVKNDGDLNRINLRYLASQNFSTLEETLRESLQWEKFNHTRADLFDGNTDELSIPGGGFMKSLYHDCCSVNFPVIGVLAFSSEGSGTQDSLHLVQGVASLIKVLRQNDASSKDLPVTWRIPSSWSKQDLTFNIPRNIQAIY